MKKFCKKIKKWQIYYRINIMNQVLIQKSKKLKQIREEIILIF